MATQEEILAAARDLGKLIASHEATKAYDDALKKLDKDQDAQRALIDYQRAAQTVLQKEATGQPVEVADKRKLESLQTAVATNLSIQAFQKAQFDYVELLRQADNAIQEEASPESERQALQGAQGAAGAGPAGPGPATGAGPGIVTGV